MYIENWQLFIIAALIWYMADKIEKLEKRVDNLENGE